MTITKSQLKKLKVTELKDIMRANGIKGLSKRKALLIESIISSSKWESISRGVSLPERKKKVFSEKQLKAQKDFADRRRKKVVKICPKGKAVCDCDENEKIKIPKREFVPPRKVLNLRDLMGEEEEENRIDRIVLKKRIVEEESEDDFVNDLAVEMIEDEEEDEDDFVNDLANDIIQDEEDEDDFVNDLATEMIKDEKKEKKKVKSRRRLRRHNKRLLRKKKMLKSENQTLREIIETLMIKQ